MRKRRRPEGAALGEAALGAWIGLIILTLLWEGWLAPAALAPPGLWLMFKAVPLLVPLFGLLRGNPRTYVLASLLVLLYFTEGVVVGFTQRAAGFALHSPLTYAVLEIGLSLSFFILAAYYVRARRRQMAESAAHRPRSPEERGS
jgi:uncharacterized membrane protein